VRRRRGPERFKLRPRGRVWGRAPHAAGNASRSATIGAPGWTRSRRRATSKRTTSTSCASPPNPLRWGLAGFASMANTEARSATTSSCPACSYAPERDTGAQESALFDQESVLAAPSPGGSRPGDGDLRRSRAPSCRVRGPGRRDPTTERRSPASSAHSSTMAARSVVIFASELAPFAQEGARDVQESGPFAQEHTRDGQESGHLAREPSPFLNSSSSLAEVRAAGPQDRGGEARSRTDRPPSPTSDERYRVPQRNSLPSQATSLVLYGNAPTSSARHPRRVRTLRRSRHAGPSGLGRRPPSE